MKLVPRDRVKADMLAWMPWEKERTLPFSMEGATGRAWVKVLSWDAGTGAESLLYRLEPGWSLDEIENTVPEDLMVWHGELRVGEHTLGKYDYSYRPPGQRLGPCSTHVGATVVSFCGAPHAASYSKIPVPALHTETMPWNTIPVSDTWTTYWKPLRADEETLDVFRLMRVEAGSYTTNLETHEGMGAVEEVFTLESGAQPLYEAWDGRVVKMSSSSGLYVCHGPVAHGNDGTPHPVDHITFKRDGYAHVDRGEPISERVLAMFRKETPAVRALKQQGREPDSAPVQN